MRRIQRQYGISFLLASHDARVVKQADTIIHLLDGRIVAEGADAELPEDVALEDGA